MEFLPRSLGTRPRLACEVSAEGVVSARAEDAQAVLSAVSRVLLADEVVVPRLNAIDATGAPADAVSESANAVATGVGGNAAGRAAIVAAVRKTLEAVCLRNREVTLIVPDSSVRVLLLDFDELSTKPAEALPVVRFRLKKLLPFDADGAAISYQVMATTKGVLQVLAVAMPRELQSDYENVVREAGFEPGAILPSTLAALAGLAESTEPQLVVNAGHEGVTTAIVKNGVLLLHRSVDLSTDLRADQQTPQLTEAAQLASSAVRLPLIDREHSAEEWASQEPVSFEDRSNAGIAAESEPTTTQPTSDSLYETTNEVAQAVSVAAAYFEDTLESSPTSIQAAGPLGAKTLSALLNQAHVGPLTVQEILHAEMLGAGASTAGSPGGVPLGWLAGVRGALTN